MLLHAFDLLLAYFNFVNCDCQYV